MTFQFACRKLQRSKDLEPAGLVAQRRFRALLAKRVAGTQITINHLTN